MIGLLSSMNAHVALERLQVAEVGAADLTGVWLLSSVDEHVGAQVGHLVGVTAMTITRKKKVSTASSTGSDWTSSQTGCCNSSNLHKSGAARLTLVRLFSRVDAGVRLEVGRSVELGATDVAVVRFRTWSRRRQLDCTHASVGVNKGGQSIPLLRLSKSKDSCVKYYSAKVNVLIKLIK